MEKERIAFLLAQYRNGIISDAELEELSEWIKKDKKGEWVPEGILLDMEGMKAGSDVDKKKWEPVLQRIVSVDKGLKVVPVRRMFTWGRVAAAAVVLFVVCGLWFVVNRETVKPETVAVQSNDVSAPAATKATITLSNGQKIVLDSAGNGTLATQGNVNITKLADGQIEYNESSTSHSPPGEDRGEAFNVLMNPRGSKVVNITLADGTKVWLNAESSLRYPTAFVGKERKVFITGEGYFEVSKNASKKFLVESRGITTEVLGTHFNVNAYEDEAEIKVTLLEGSVRVILRSPQREGLGVKPIMLKPGQQATTINNNQLTINNNIDTDEIMSWKNGIFLLDNTDLPTIMRQISRWYDVNVVYESKVSEAKFVGGVSKNLPLSKILKLLQSNGIEVELEGKTLKVK